MFQKEKGDNCEGRLSLEHSVNVWSLSLFWAMTSRSPLSE